MLKKSLILTLGVLLGCGTTVEVELRNGEVIEGLIVGGNRSELFVEAGGQETRIERRMIAEIDHPGNVLAAIGGTISAYGLYNIAVGEPKCDEKGAAFCVGVFLPLVLGLGLIVPGVITYQNSVAAAEPPARYRKGSLSILPTLWGSGTSVASGLSLTGRY
jgi:hypothetical protein